MRNLVAALALSLVSGLALAKGYPVGVGHPAPVKPGVRMATAPGGSLTVNWASKTINADGSSMLMLVYQNASNTQVSSRAIFVDAACSIAKDGQGNIVAQPPPSSFCTSITTEVTQTNSLISTAAGAGKLNL